MSLLKDEFPFSPSLLFEEWDTCHESDMDDEAKPVREWVSEKVVRRKVVVRK